MGPIQFVVFDLAGTTIEDDEAVLRCLVETAQAFVRPGTPDELNALMGMYKREVFGLSAARLHPDDAAQAKRLRIEH